MPGGRGQRVVKGQHPYHLVRSDGTIGDRTFEIQVLESGVQAYSFTFG